MSGSIQAALTWIKQPPDVTAILTSSSPHYSGWPWGVRRRHAPWLESAPTTSPGNPLTLGLLSLGASLGSLIHAAGTSFLQSVGTGTMSRRWMDRLVCVCVHAAPVSHHPSPPQAETGVARGREG